LIQCDGKRRRSRRGRRRMRGRRRRMRRRKRRWGTRVLGSA
jgi:hypothetical protein